MAHPLNPLLRPPWLLVGVAVSLSVAACDSNPIAPTAHPPELISPVSATPSGSTAVTVAQEPTVDLARCLQDQGAASCFNRSVGPASADRARPATIPFAPVNLNGTINPGDTLRLEWGAPPDLRSGVLAYIIEAGSTVDASDLASFSTGNALTTYTTSGVAPGWYFVRVRAVTADGTSIPSNTVKLFFYRLDGVCSGPPRNLRASLSSNGMAITLDWTPPDRAPLLYQLQAGLRSGGNEYIGGLNFDGDVRQYTLNLGFPLNSTYYIRITAWGYNCSPSVGSNEVVVSAGSGACASAPRTLLNASQTAGTISLTWSAPATGSPTSYVIVAGSAPGRSDLANFDTGTSALSYLATGVPAGSYYVRVYSKSSCGLSSASNEVLVYVVGFTGDVQVSVSWDAPSDVDLHIVEPSGTEIYWGNTTSSSGGALDVDSNPACTIDGRQIENIRYGSRAPTGTYTVRVDYWSGCSVSQTNYVVTVKNGGSVTTYTGSFTGAGDRGGSGSGRTITTFSHVASLLTEPSLRLFRSPAAFTASPEKRRLSVPK